MKKEENRWNIGMKYIYAHKIKCVLGRANELYVGEGNKVHRLQI